MPNYDYICEQCENRSVELVSYSNRDEKQLCSECNSVTSVRFYGKMPGLTKASYLDGQKREGFEELRVDNRLQRAAIDAKGKGKLDDVKEIDKEYSERKTKKS